MSILMLGHYRGKGNLARWLCLVVNAIFVGTILILSGCTLGNYGTLVARYTYTDSAIVMDVYGLGLQLRPSDPDGGATLGFRRTSYVLLAKETKAGLTSSGWTWFYAPWPSSELIARASTSIGFELQATPEISRLTLGYVDQVITVGSTPSESRVVTLYYNRAIPQLTYLSIKVMEGESDQ